VTGRTLVLVLAVGGLCAFSGARDAAPLDPPLDRPPLPAPLVVNGGFCEYRIGHFHAGLDLGTRQHVGMQVMAPSNGWVERIRASGVGYGRSVYLHCDDGRLIQLGHLDAFVEPLASYVAGRQDSTAQYEQDLWPERDRFRFRAGQPIAWSGESGAGGPHLHFEIRRGDMAYHPLRAGLIAEDTTAPSIAGVTLDPLDDSSYVEGAAAPHAVQFGSRPETLRVIGRARAVVGARDGLWRGVDRMVPWSVSEQWEGHTVECRFDSVSWATDMVESDYVYDAGRVEGGKGLVLWAPAGFRPRVLRADVTAAHEAGTIEVRRGDPPRALVIGARDLAGHSVERVVTIVPDPRGETERTAAPTAGAAAPGGTGGPDYADLEFQSLPGGWLRVTETGIPAGAREVRVTPSSLGRAFAATPCRRGWCVILPLGRDDGPPRYEEFQIDARLADGRPWTRSLIAGLVAVDPGDSCVLETGYQRASLPVGAVFERGVVLLYATGHAASAGELEPVGITLALGPTTMPLRKAFRLSLVWSGHGNGLGLYRQGDDGWEWVAAEFDSVRGTIVAEPRRLGRFGVFRDATAPRLTLLRPSRRPAAGAYSRWAVEAGVSEGGSGLDARASRLEVDGRAVPTEWDSEERMLRWRPRRPPAKGTHRVGVVAADRAGNQARVSGTFVLD